MQLGQQFEWYIQYLLVLGECWEWEIWGLVEFGLEREINTLAPFGVALKANHCERTNVTAVCVWPCTQPFVYHQSLVDD